MVRAGARNLAGVARTVRAGAATNFPTLNCSSPTPAAWASLASGDTRGQDGNLEP
jgi:hypothetical protein